MVNSIYKINKGINKAIEFKGLKAQYIWWVGGGLIGLLILFAVMYIAGVNAFICIAVILGAGCGWMMYVFKISNKYGEHGMKKAIAKKSIPKLIKCNSRSMFM
jgi:Domain of unknown function (DUF4133)